jgi:hypothetical protein
MSWISLRMSAGALRFTLIAGLLALAATVVRGQTALTNGGSQPGTLGAGGTVAYTFTGAAGQSVMLRVGATNFVPKIELFAANGLLLGTAPATAPFNSVRDVLLTNTLPAADTYTVKVSGYYAGGGSFGLRLVAVPGTFTVSPGDEGGMLQNGDRVDGQTDLGDLDAWTFTGTAGDSIQLRIGATETMVPRLDLYGPDGKLITTEPATAPATSTRDVGISTQLAVSGTFTVVASSYYQNSSGYRLSFSRSPGAFSVPAGDDGGTLVNGAFNTGFIDLGDLDMWSFDANLGDSLQVRMGSTNVLVPRLDIYGPNGALLFTAPANAPFTSTRDVVQYFQAAATGTYTVVASSYYQNSGGYSISLARAPGAIRVSPGDQGGALTNGLRHTGFLALGDLDVWSFDAGAGNGIELRMGTTDVMVPRIDLYGPDGALIATDPPTAPFTSSRDSAISTHAPIAGTYTVVVSSYYQNSGEYSLTLVKTPGEIFTAPGDDGGALTNGWLHTGTIDLGDLDAWQFSGNAGDSIELRIGTSDVMVPRIDFYGPDGTLIATAPPTAPFTSTRDVLLTNRLASSGLFTVIVSSYYQNSGKYNLTLAHAPVQTLAAPGDEGGTMVNGFVYQGTNVLGDLDVWSFYGTPGDSNVFRIGTVSSTPFLRLYGPSGAIVKDSGTLGTGARTNQMVYTVTDPGTYTLVSEAQYQQSGAYNLKQSRVPPDINMPALIAIDEGQTLNVPITSQDPDDPNKVLAFKLDGAPPGVSLTSVGPTNAVITWPTTEADGPSTNTFRVMVTDIVNVSSFTRTNTFTVVVNEVNVAPVLTVPANTEINELTPLTVSASATDVDIPSNPLTFSLLSPPPGMNIDPASGAISWIPTEAQGPGTYNISVVVTDDSPSAVNAQHLSTTNSFTVTVHEVNTPPQVTIKDQVIDEGKTLSVPVAVVDTDLPANGQTFALVTGPAGMTIDSATGAISWTPTEAQGPSSNPVTVRVTDSNPAAVNEQHLSTDVAFSVTVNEVNSPPVLGAIASQTIDELQTLTVPNTASDPDLPANSLTYALAGAPSGVSISPTGVITWTPTEAQGPTNVTITTVVTDNGVPPLSATNSFSVAVNEVNSAPVLSAIGAQTIDELQPLTVSNGATDADLPANTLAYTLVGAPTGATISPSGVITWTPTEAQGPANVTITMIVTDNGVPPLSATNSFSVTVNEVNLPPTIADIPDQSVHFATALTIHPTVTDSDVPTNSVTLTLENAPKGMTLDASTGTITWTPAEADLGVYNVTLRATDNGSPVQSSTKTFKVTVTGSGAGLEVKMLAGNLIELDITADAGHTYAIEKATDLPHWDTLVQVPLTSATYKYIDPLSETRRFYRLKLLQ